MKNQHRLASHRNRLRSHNGADPAPPKPPIAGESVESAAPPVTFPFPITPAFDGIVARPTIHPVIDAYSLVILGFTS